MIQNLTSKIQNLQQHSGFMKYFRNTSWLFGEKILQMVVGLFVGIWVARYLGPEQFGLFSYALAFISMFGFFVTLGMDGGYIVKELKSDKNSKEVLATSLFLKFIGSILAIAFISIIVRFIEDDNLTITLVTLASFTYIFKVFSVFDLYFQSKVLSKYVVYSNLTALIVVSIIKVYLIINNFPLEAFIYASLVEVAVASFLYILFYLKNSEVLGVFKVDFKYAKNILKNTWPIMISAFLISVYMQIDIVMIKNMLGDSEAGNYAAATKISALFYFIPMAISSSVYPAILNAKKISEELYYKRFEQLFTLSVLIMLPTSIFITLFADDIIFILYTDSYSLASSVLMIHIWAAVFIFFNNIQWKWYVTENLQHLALVRITFATLINVALNLYIIPIYGINGAAISTLVSFIFAGYLGNLLLGENTMRIFIAQTKALLLFPAISMIRKKLYE